MQIIEQNSKTYKLTINTTLRRELYLNFSVDKGTSSDGLGHVEEIIIIPVNWSYYFDDDGKNPLFQGKIHLSSVKDYPALICASTAVEAFKNLQDSIIKMLNYLGDDLEDTDKISWYNKVYNP